MSGQRVDLDAAQARDERANKPPYSVRDIAESQADVADLVAELRAAREVLRLAPRPPRFNTPTAEYVAALDAYDKASRP